MEGNVRVIGDFEGAMVGPASVEGDVLKLGIKREAITKGYRLEFDYNLHFLFGIENASEGDRDLRVCFDCDPDEGLDRDLNYIWTSKDPKGPYTMVEAKGRINEGFPVKYSFPLRVPSGTILYVANFHPIDHEALGKRIAEKAEASHFRRGSYGTSVQGRELYYHIMGDPKTQPVLVFTAGYHPPEEDPIAIEAILDSISERSVQEKVMGRFCIVLIPFLNPDGFALSMQGSNADGINFHWHFFEGEKGSCPEAQALWELLSDLKPSFFMDFHAFTFQSWKSRPYSIPSGYQVGSRSKMAQKNLDRALKGLCEGRYSISEKIMAPDILVTRLRKEFGTITSPKFHINWQDGLDSSMDLTKRVFVSVIESFESSDVSSPDQILLSPHGKVIKGPFTDLSWSMLDTYYFDLRPLLGKLKASLMGGGGKR